MGFDLKTAASAACGGGGGVLRGFPLWSAPVVLLFCAFGLAEGLLPEAMVCDLGMSSVSAADALMWVGRVAVTECFGWTGLGGDATRWSMT